METKQKTIVLAALLFLVLAFCCRALHEPDVWWQLATGRWIVENRTIPYTDVLSFTYAGDPWVNIKWVAEVIIFGIAKIFGPEWLPLFSGFLMLLIMRSFYILYKNNGKNIYAFGMAAILFLVIISNRLNGRPEIFSYCFTALYLLVFSFSTKNKKWLWTLPVLQVLWTNTHEAYGVGVFMLMVFAVANIRSENGKNWLKYLAPIGLSLAAMALNPIGVKIYAYTFNLFSQLSANRFTTELLSALDERYWDLFAILNIFTAVLTACTVLAAAQASNWKWNKFQQKMAFHHLVFLSAFFYLSLKSHRNIPFFQIAAFPLYLQTIESSAAFRLLRSQITFSVLAIVLYMLVVSNVFYQQFDRTNRFGLGISPQYNPIGATEYLKPVLRRNQKVFSDFLVSNYPLYQLYPEFKSYIDLRDLDIFPPAFFKNCMVVYQAPETMVSSTQNIWQMADSIDHFDYVLLSNQPAFRALHRNLNRSQEFELVFVDPVAAVFHRTNRKDTLSKTSFSNYSFPAETGMAKAINSILNPFYSKLQPIDFNVRYFEEMYESQYK
ncbi:MAG: hypothetical protein U0T73_11510 [Chitinophagales bacterium]